MIKSQVILNFAVISLSLIGVVWAQSSPKPVLPSGPLVNHIPKPGFWSVTETYPQEEQKGQSGAPASLDTISGCIRTLTMENDTKSTHVSLTQVGGAVMNMWKSMGNVYEQVGKGSWAIGTASGNSNVVSNSYLDAATFPGVDWIKADDFVGQVKINGGECLLFIAGLDENQKAQINLDDAASVNYAVAQAANAAIIDLQSRNPIEVRSGGVKEVFQYGAAPTRLVLPADLADQIAQGKRVQYLLSMRAPRPY